MKDRLLKFLTKEQLSSARFAEIIGVQPSSISHLLSGRNKPGFDFIQKILTSFPMLNAEWLILGKGPMLKLDVVQGDLFSQGNNEFNNISNKETNNQSSDQNEIIGKNDSENKVTNVISSKEDLSYKSNSNSNDEVTNVISGKVVEKIVILYSDKSFSEYSPE